jgi:hypothetical protein
MQGFPFFVGPMSVHFYTAEAVQVHDGLNGGNGSFAGPLARSLVASHVPA